MAADRSAAELERFLAERADHLLRTAALLAGSKEAGEDLLQTAVERLALRAAAAVTALAAAGVTVVAIAVPGAGGDGTRVPAPPPLTW